MAVLEDILPIFAGQLKSMDLFAKLREMEAEISAYEIVDEETLEQFRIRFLGSKNAIKPLFGEIRNVPAEQKGQYGQQVNQLKQLAESRFKDFKQQLAQQKSAGGATVDLGLPPDPTELGARHPVSIVMDKIIRIFSKIGFSVAEDREIEDDWYNFTAMNTPEDHPARDMQDTFYLQDSSKLLLRTHTSSVQSRVMTTQKPPIRVIAPGRVYRNETVSARSHCQFHQVEGLYIDEGVSFADMKQTLLYFAKQMYGPDIKIRLRPSYFPFTEPSAEMDIYWGLEGRSGLPYYKGNGLARSVGLWDGRPGGA